jgi:hypothetical protein
MNRSVVVAVVVLVVVVVFRTVFFFFSLLGMSYRKIRLGVTPMKVVYHAASGLVVTAVTIPHQNDDIYYRCALQKVPSS